jgi:cytochrome c biogenesis protein CcmG, thiol:disulfide interchange protein DsbE
MSGRRLIVLSVVLVLAGLAALVVGGLLLAGGNDATGPRDSASGTVEVDARAPAIVGRDPVTGTTVSLARVKKKPVVLTVWASWCAACRRQAARFGRFARKHRREVATIGLDLEDEAADARAFYERVGWTFRSIGDPDGKLVARLGVEELPTTLFLDRDRLIVARVAGVASRRDLERGLAQAQ